MEGVKTSRNDRKRNSVSIHGQDPLINNPAQATQMDTLLQTIIQKEATEGELVPIILLTHRTREQHMNDAIRQLESLADIAGPVTRIRVESLDEQ